MSKPIKIEKVKGCRDCPFRNIDMESGSECNLGAEMFGDAFYKGDPYYRAANCPLINANICVELDT